MLQAWEDTFAKHVSPHGHESEGQIAEKDLQEYNQLQIEMAKEGKPFLEVGL